MARRPGEISGSPHDYPCGCARSRSGGLSAPAARRPARPGASAPELPAAYRSEPAARMAPEGAADPAPARGVLEEMPSGQDPEHDTAAVLRGKRLSSELARLPGPVRTALILQVRDGLSYEEIAVKDECDAPYDQAIPVDRVCAAARTGSSGLIEEQIGRARFKPKSLGPQSPGKPRSGSSTCRELTPASSRKPLPIGYAARPCMSRSSCSSPPCTAILARLPDLRGSRRGHA